MIAAGVERVELHRTSLPWSPQPYEVELLLEVDSADLGNQSPPPWPLIVVPSGAELVSTDPLLTGVVP